MMHEITLTLWTAFGIGSAQKWTQPREAEKREGSSDAAGAGVTGGSHLEEA
jgi:hypothetical protein